MAWALKFKVWPCSTARHPTTTCAAQAAERQPTIDRNINRATHQNIIGKTNQNSMENRPRIASGGARERPWDLLGQPLGSLGQPWEALVGGPGVFLEGSSLEDPPRRPQGASGRAAARSFLT